MRRPIVPIFCTLLFGALLASAVWGIRGEALGSSGHANAEGPRQGAWLFEPVLESLELSQEQVSRIQHILAADVERLQRIDVELREAARALGVAAGSPPFDEELAGRIVRHRAELSAYQWGTQARVESQVYQTLMPAQRVVYSELRALGEESPSERVARRGN
jgi:Spy/CpxP family protein refolding chaperone